MISIAGFDYDFFGGVSGESELKQKMPYTATTPPMDIFDSLNTSQQNILFIVFTVWHIDTI